MMGDDGGTTVSEMAEEYGVDDSSDASLDNVQAQIAESLAQICPETFDDTVKCNSMWSLLDAMYLLDTHTNSETTIIP